MFPVPVTGRAGRRLNSAAGASLGLGILLACGFHHATIIPGSEELPSLYGADFRHAEQDQVDCVFQEASSKGVSVSITGDPWTRWLIF
jgi:hypothetical protein